MAIKWSKQQEAVIYHRNKNMLVSAAAGSGKTAVLVKRIISLLTDEDKPANLDRMLIVTFTKAAAGEMKERIRKALEEMISSDPCNEHLKSQAILIHNAKISTLHSFCSGVIKNYFCNINIDPTFRIMDDGEERLMKTDCAREVLEEAFEAKRQEILEFAASYTTGKSTKKIQEMIISAYNALEAQPYADVWMRDALSWWNIDSANELEENVFMRNMLLSVSAQLKELLNTAKENLNTALLPGGPLAYVPAIEADIELLGELCEAKSYAELRTQFGKMKFKTLGTSKKKDENPALRQRVKDARNDVKNAVTELFEKYFTADEGQIILENRICRRYIEAFFDLIRDFSRLYAEKKRSKNLMDYGDLEHFTLEILLERNEDGTLKRTEAAKEIADSLDYVMTDEYQDSNDIQELILSAVSGNEDGRNNRFMVGDIKQSIYGFRNASPEIFLNKYIEYKNDGINSEVIDLHDNYRSSLEVINTLNHIFERIMSQNAGGVDYDDSHALHKGLAAGDKDESVSSELLIVDMTAEDADTQKKADAEALLIANEIKALKAQDFKADADRVFEYKDCAVLVRTTEAAENMRKILLEEGIAAYTESKRGYFTTVEVSTILNFIGILDNPLQDIPFTAVLFSPIVGLSTDELARIRLIKKEGRLYKAARRYAESGTDKRTAERLKSFFSLYDELFLKSKYMSVSALISEIYEKTGYRSYAAAMPGGEQRAANLDKLLIKASDYEKTSYSGLFNFIRYIEELKKEDQDSGEASLFSGAGNAVQIMTIHKSKGLEFPVVFLSGCARGFNVRGAYETILINKNMGIGIDAVDLSAGKKKATLYKRLISDEIHRSAQSEELRVLYVALTRAKKKLYMTAAVNDIESRLNRAIDKKPRGGRISYRSILSAKSFLDMILPAFADHKMFETLAHVIGVYDSEFEYEGEFVKARLVSIESLNSDKKRAVNRLSGNLKALPLRGSEKIYDTEIHALFKEIDSFEYPFKAKENIPAKVSVSSIKHMHMLTDDEQVGFEAQPEAVVIPYIPSFIQEGDELHAGAARGTAYHKLWKYLDYKRLDETENIYSEIKAQAESLNKKRILSDEEFKSIYIRDFKNFAESSLGMRMRAAALRGELFREQPFTALINADFIDSSWDMSEDVIIQGVIDAYFIEEDNYILVDYKTDYVSDETGAELAAKYKSQLDIYEMILQRDVQKSVKEKLIYSTHLKKCVTL